MDRGANPADGDGREPPGGQVTSGTKRSSHFASLNEKRTTSEPQPNARSGGWKDDASPPLKKKQKTADHTTEKPAPYQSRPEQNSRTRPPLAAAESSLRSSPFRIRVGCVVALRCHRSECPSLHIVGPNSPTKKDRSRVRLFPQGPGSGGGGGGGSWIRVWTDPIPGRDEGLNLIGKRVRVQVPRLTPGQEKTVLEGEIIRLLDYGPPATGRLPKPHKPLRVELLIDSRQLQIFPFLKRVEHYDAPTGAPTLAGGTVGASASEASAVLRRHRQQQRQQEFEMRIRGHGTDVVIVKLAPAYSVLAFGKSTLSTYFGSTSAAAPKGATDAGDLLKENASRASSVGLSWAVLRLVPANLWWDFQRQPVDDSAPRPPKALTSGKVNGAGEPCATGEGQNAMEISSSAVGGTDGVEAKVESGNLNRSDQTALAPLLAKKIAKKAKKGLSTAPVVQGVRHMGDRADTSDRQVHNWRWFAGRFYDLLLRSSAPTSSNSGSIRSAAASPSSVSLSSLDGLLGQVLCGGLLGEVTQIDRTEGDDTQQSLARVTIRRLVLPEHTRSGRLPIHESCDVFKDHDGISFASDISDELFEIPIEQLIIVGRKLHRLDSAKDAAERPQSSLEFLQISHTYSLRDDQYRSLCPDLKCQRFLEAPTTFLAGREPEGDRAPEGHELSRTTHFGSSNGASVKSPFSQAEDSAKSLTSSGLFYLPSDFLKLVSLPKPQVQPIVRASGRVAASRRKERQQSINRPLAIPRKECPSKVSSNGASMDTLGFSGNPPVDHQPLQPPATPEPDPDLENNICSRILMYDGSQKRSSGTVALVTDRPRNLRELRRQQKSLESQSAVSSTKTDDKSDSRASRANQRRFMKDAAANSSWLMGMDTLASREPQLRFDRSGIHSWGVFADENIATGEMIVEYRGELIGVAVTEKREAEYLEAKIGSDYMFRIDNLICCDATKQGNVARFINASCDPNCFTKIITLDGTKRIVIYAKRDIRAGEELCYDYKFPLEYDEAKRIPCHCGSKNCRGFMNWNKRYVALDGNKAKHTSQKLPTAAQSNCEVKPALNQLTVSSRVGSFGTRIPSPSEISQVVDRV